MTKSKSHIKHWIESMRLRTLPVSIAGVGAGWAVAKSFGAFSLWPGMVCLVFAIVAQVASNFANEYYDYKNGIDHAGRIGFRRGVTEGDISPRAMKGAAYFTLALACAIGLLTLIWTPWWILAVGVLIALAALAYSAGPWPLSHHGLGDLTVLLFYGLVPVFFTVYVCARATGTPLGCSVDDMHLSMAQSALSVGVGVGMLAANVLMVNNYRDYDDDASVGKNTTVVILGRNVVSYIYLISGLVAVALLGLTFAGRFTALQLLGGLFIFVLLQFSLWDMLRTGAVVGLNRLLGLSAILMLLEVGWIFLRAF